MVERAKRWVPEPIRSVSVAIAVALLNEPIEPRQVADHRVFGDRCLTP